MLRTQCCLEVVVGLKARVQENSSVEGYFLGMGHVKGDSSDMCEHTGDMAEKDKTNHTILTLTMATGGGRWTADTASRATELN